jgi:FAD dependent oxidoreductase
MASDGMSRVQVSEYDVVVGGGGIAGVAAAATAARAGARTLLIEQRGYVGGVAASGLGILNFHDAAGRQVVGGFADELVDRLYAEGGSSGHVPTTGGLSISTYTAVDPESVKHLTEQVLLEAGVELRYFALVTGALMQGRALRGLVLVSKDGVEHVRAGAVVDATGDADIAVLAGAPFQVGREGDGAMQAMTLVVRFGGVDTLRLPTVFPEHVTWRVDSTDGERRFLRLIAQMEPFRAQAGDGYPWPDANRLLWMISLHDGDVVINNATRVIGVDGASARELTRAEIEGRRQAALVARFLKRHVPGYERSHLVGTAPNIGVRETRRIVGEYVLTAEDVLGGREFPDRIARCSYPIDVHPPDGKGWVMEHVADGGSYSIPYRCLLPRDVDHLVVVGRCVSADHRAIASARVMAPVMAMAQAGGLAAAAAAQQRRSPRELDVAALQQALREGGAVLDNPAAVTA